MRTLALVFERLADTGIASGKLVTYEKVIDILADESLS